MRLIRSGRKHVLEFKFVLHHISPSPKVKRSGFSTAWASFLRIVFAFSGGWGYVIAGEPNLEGSTCRSS